MTEFDTVHWRQFLPGFRWRQGEHVAVIKPTGGGKTTLVGELLTKREPGPATVVFITKARDKTFAKTFPANRGWTRIYEWPPPRHVNRVLLWPKFNQGMSIPQYQAIQRRVFTDALDRIFGEGGWTVYFDEESVLCDELGLANRVKFFMQQGRSAGLTVINGIQRPAFVPLATYPNSTHGFVGHTTEPDDMKRIASLGGVDSRAIKEVAPTLDYFQFLYIPARSKGRVPVITEVDLSESVPLHAVRSA